MIRRHTPGAKAPFSSRLERPKAEALGYLEASLWNDNLWGEVGR